MRAETQRFHFEPRATPLEPTLLVALTPCVASLIKRLLRMNDETLTQLRAARWSDGVSLRGTTELLPWVDGVSYLAEVPEAPGLWLPTTLTTTVHPIVVRDALLRRSHGRGAIALLPTTRTVLSLAALDHIDRAKLRKLLVAEGGP